METQLATRFNVGSGLHAEDNLEVSSSVREKIGIVHFERGPQELILAFESVRYIDSMIAHLTSIKRQMIQECPEGAPVHEYWKSKPKTHETMDRINFSSRGDAQYALDKLLSILNEHGEVTLEDYYSETLPAPTTNPDYKCWGWTSLAGAQVALTDTGWYYLYLPLAKKLHD